MRVLCHHCAAPLTSDLTLVSFATRNERYEQDLLASGTLMQEDGSYFQSRNGSYLANIADVDHVVLTTDTRRLNGCCGLDGCDGPNLQCAKCGTYIGTKRTDCWTPHYIEFDPLATTVTES